MLECTEEKVAEVDDETSKDDDGEPVVASVGTVDATEVVEAGPEGLVIDGERDTDETIVDGEGATAGDEPVVGRERVASEVSMEAIEGWLELGIRTLEVVVCDSWTIGGVVVLTKDVPGNDGVLSVVV